MIHDINKNEIKTEIIIRASREKIWETLTHLEAWSAWNPFMVEARGQIQLGAQLVLTFLNNGKRIPIKPQVTELEVNHKFAWLGSGLAGGFKGNHYFELEDTGQGQTKLIHGERFTGWLVWLILPLIKKETQNGFIQMNRALKDRVEK